MSTELDRIKPGAIVEHRPDLRETLMAQIADPDTPMEIREKALNMIERVQDRWAAQQFNLAKASAQRQMPTIDKNGLIVRPPNERSKGSSTSFAKWDDVHQACTPILYDHGFACSFSSELQGGNALAVTMTVKHSSGHEDKSTLVVPWLDAGGSKSPAQAAASSFTLAQRHVFCKYWNILTRDQDDDGSGKGVPDRITDEQAMKLEDLVQEFTNKDSNFRRRFLARLQKEMHTDSVAGLFQGEQYDTVLGWFREKAGR